MSSIQSAVFGTVLKLSPEGLKRSSSIELRRFQDVLRTGQSQCLCIFVLIRKRASIGGTIFLFRSRLWPWCGRSTLALRFPSSFRWTPWSTPTATTLRPSTKSTATFSRRWQNVDGSRRRLRRQCGRDLIYLEFDVAMQYMDGTLVVTIIIIIIIMVLWQLRVKRQESDIYLRLGVY